MMHSRIIFHVLGVLLVLLSCNKNETLQTDFLIFGKFHGFCQGETCIETFMIKDNKLYEDAKDKYRSLDDFNFVPLDNSKYELVKNMFNYVPSKLWNEPNEKVFGCPDCYDQGGYLIKLSKNGIVKSWILDSNPKDVPVYLHDFMQKMDEAIVLINE